MLETKLQTKLIFEVPIPEDNFPVWDFIIEIPVENKNEITVIKTIKKKYYDRRKCDSKLF